MIEPISSTLLNRMGREGIRLLFVYVIGLACFFVSLAYHPNELAAAPTDQGARSVAIALVQSGTASAAESLIDSRTVFSNQSFKVADLQFALLLWLDGQEYIVSWCQRQLMRHTLLLAKRRALMLFPFHDYW